MFTAVPESVESVWKTPPRAYIAVYSTLNLTVRRNSDLGNEGNKIRGVHVVLLHFLLHLTEFWEANNQE